MRPKNTPIGYIHQALHIALTLPKFRYQHGTWYYSINSGARDAQPLAVLM